MNVESILPASLMGGLPEEPTGRLAPVGAGMRDSTHGLAVETPAVAISVPASDGDGESTRSKLRKAHQDIATLEARLQQTHSLLSGSGGDLGKRLSDSVAAMAETREQFTAVQDQNFKLARELGQLKKAAAEADGRAAEAEKRAALAAETAEALEAARQKLASIEKTSGQHIETERALFLSRSEAEVSQKRYRAFIRKLEEEAQTRENLLQEVETERDTFSAESKRANESLAELETHVANRDRRRREAETALIEAQAELAALRKSHEARQQRLAEELDAAGEAQQRASESAAAAAQLREAHDGLVEKVAVLESQAHGAAGERRQLREKTAQQTAELEATNADLARTQKELSATLLALTEAEKQFSALRAEYSEHADRLALMEAHSIEAGEKSEAAAQDRARLEEALGVAKKQLSESEQAWQAERELHARERNQAATQLARVHGQVEALKLSNDELRTGRDQAVENLQEAREHLAGRERRHEGLESSLSELQDRLRGVLQHLSS